MTLNKPINLSGPLLAHLQSRMRTGRLVAERCRCFVNTKTVGTLSFMKSTALILHVLWGNAKKVKEPESRGVISLSSSLPRQRCFCIFFFATQTQKANNVTSVYGRCYNNSNYHLSSLSFVKSYIYLYSAINLKVHLSISQKLQRM